MVTTQSAHMLNDQTLGHQITVTTEVEVRSAEVNRGDLSRGEVKLQPTSLSLHLSLLAYVD